MNNSKIVKEISQMGFTEQLVVKALNTNDNNSEETIELLKNLKKKVSPNASYAEESRQYCNCGNCCSDCDYDPLDSLRNNAQFNQTRENILKFDSESINTILKKDVISKNWGKELLENITYNQEMFLKLMADKTVDNVDKMSCEINLSEDDNLVIEKIKALAFLNAK